MNTFRMHSFLIVALAAVAAPTASLRAQFGGDPQREIQEIAESIDKQLKEIDRLLLESGKAGQSRAKPREMLEQAAEGTRIVEHGLDKLIEKLQDMSNQSSNSRSSGQQSSGQQSQSEPSQSGQGQMGRSDGNRRENQTPEFIDQGQREGQQQGEQQGQQPGEQEGQQQGQEGQQDQQSQNQQQNGNPQQGQESRTGGQNQTGNNPPQSPIGPGNRGDGQGSWGELQPYLNFLRNRGTSPEVPAKYRKYYEAYRKGKAEKGQ